MLLISDHHDLQFSQPCVISHHLTCCIECYRIVPCTVYEERGSTKQNTCDTMGRHGGTIEYRTPGINNSVEVRAGGVFEGGLILEYLIVEVFDVLGP